MFFQALHEQAMELVEDFTVLTASGIDVNTVVGKMGDSIQDFVSTAMRTGGEVPEAMRPMTGPVLVAVAEPASAELEQEQARQLTSSTMEALSHSG